MGQIQSKEKFYKQKDMLDVTYPIYWDAYSDYFQDLWNGIKEVRDVQLQIRDLSYYRMLSCFWFETDEDFQDRRIALYHYMKRGFKYLDPESLLNRYFDILPVTSDVKTNLQQICTAYDEAPSRVFSNTKTIDRFYKDLYDLGNVNSSMQDVYELAKLCNVVAVAPVFKFEDEQWKLRLIYKTPDGFRIKTNPNNPWKVDELIYPDWSDKSNNYIYHIWTDSGYFIKDSQGQIAVEEMSEMGNPNGDNPYGKIPFVFLKLHKGKEFLDGGRLADVMNNLRNNKIAFGSELTATLAGFPIPFGVNIETKEISPDKVLGAMSKLSVEDQTPEFQWIDPGTNYLSLHDYLEGLQEYERQKLGIPQDNAGESGIARILSRQRLIEERIRDLPALANFEKNLAQLIRHIGLVDGIITDKTELDFSIDYADERVYNEPEAERNFDLEKLKNQEISIEDYYTKWGNFDTIITEDKLKKIIEKRKALYEEIKGNGNGMDISDDSDESNDSDDIRLDRDSEWGRGEE